MDNNTVIEGTVKFRDGKKVHVQVVLSCNLWTHGSVVPDFTVQQKKVQNVCAIVYNVTFVDLIERFWRV